MDASQENHEHDIFIVLSIVRFILVYLWSQLSKLNLNSKALHNKTVRYIKDQLTGRCSLSSLFSEHLALEWQMLTAGLTSSICPLLYFCSIQKKVEETGGLCVEKIDIIACDFRKERPFSRRAWRAIRLPLIPVLRSNNGRSEPTQTKQNFTRRIKTFCQSYFICIMI